MTIWYAFLTIWYASLKQAYQMVGIQMQPSSHLNIIFQYFKHKLQFIFFKSEQWYKTMA